MSTHNDDDDQLETQDIGTQEDQDVEDQDMDDVEEQAEAEATAEPAVGGQPTKKRERREPAELKREPGKSILQFARVLKIIKADKEIPVVAKEATFLISLATEEFIKRLCEASQHVASREKRSTIQHRDIATVARKADEFLFLEEIMPWTSPDAPAKRTKTTAASKTSGIKSSGPTILDQFVVSKKGGKEKSPDIIMNEDGTMVAANTVDYNE